MLSLSFWPFKEEENKKRRKCDASASSQTITVTICSGSDKFLKMMSSAAWLLFLLLHVVNADQVEDEHFTEAPDTLQMEVPLEEDETYGRMVRRKRAANKWKGKNGW